MKELRNQIEKMIGHVQTAKSELERMNIGKAHDELVAALDVEFMLESDEDTPQANEEESTDKRFSPF
jgi:hypothetical protein